MDLRTYHKVIEVFWLILACVTGVIIIYMVYNVGFKKVGIYLLLPAMAFIMYLLRRGMRKKMEQQ